MTIATIKNRRDFIAANAAGKFVTHSFILQQRPRPADHPVGTEIARIGYTVTKKMGNAVVRNRIKRRLREAVRKLRPELLRPGQDYVLIARQKSGACDFSELVRDMEFAFSRINAKKVP